MKFCLSNPLFALSRGPAPEIVVHGAIMTKLQDQEPVGMSDFSFLASSLLSPWQFLSADIADNQDFWSLGLAFHSGQDIHMTALEKLSEKARSGENELFCPREYPLDWEYTARLRFSNKKPMRIHHPCSGKHLLFLASCEHFGYKKDHYWDPSHPIQKKLFSFIGREAREQVQWAYDQCGLPSFFMNARTHLQMWERLCLDESEKTISMKDLWLNNPRLVGGRGRLDSDLTLAAKGKALVKEGTDGLLIVQSFPFQNDPAASCLIKISSGYNKTYLALALLSAINSNPQLPPVFMELKDYLQSRLDEWLPRGQNFLEPPFE